MYLINSNKTDNLAFIEELDIQLQSDGLVLYCDGSTKPKNPGTIGFGIHGYAYNLAKPTKGTGNPQQVHTAEGYYDAKHYKEIDNKAEVITPVYYLDVVASTEVFSSNNTAELLALKTSLEIFKHTKAKELLVKSDSEYVVRGFNEWSSVWVARNWVKRDGKPVPNKEYWQEILNLLSALLAEERKVKVIWVKGHTDSLDNYFTIFGNILSDKLANIASERALHGKHGFIINFSNIDGYWKHNDIKNPLLSHRTAYITNNSVNLKNTYFIGQHGKDDDFLGRKDANGALAVVQLNTPDIYLDMLKQYIHDNADDATRITFVRMDALYGQNRTFDIKKYKLDALMPTNKGLSLNSADKEPILRDLFPPRLGLRVLTHLDTLMNILEEYKSGNLINRKDITINDITKYFYDETEKKVKKDLVKSFTLKPEFKVGLASINLTVNHEKGSKEIKYTLGIDIPDRNTLKKLESLNPKVTCIVKQESEQCFRYYTVIETSTNEIGIWAGIYSNQVFIIN